MDFSKTTRSVSVVEKSDNIVEEVRCDDNGWRTWMVFDGYPFFESRNEDSFGEITNKEEPQVNETMAYSLSERFSSIFFATSTKEDLTSKHIERGQGNDEEEAAFTSNFVLPFCFPHMQLCSTNEFAHDIESAIEIPISPPICAPCYMDKEQTSPFDMKHSKRISAKKFAPKQHFRVFSHGRRLTILAVGMACIGTICSIDSRLSTSFVRLNKPIEVSPDYEPISYVGMIRLRLCALNETVHGRDCFLFRLSPYDVQDRLFELSRSFLSLGTALGFLMTVVLSSSIYWETINLKPVGLGFLLTYFFQTLSMLVFDSKLCNEQHCRVGSGAILGIAACCFWIGTCVAVAKMDWFKVRAARLRRKAARKMAKQARREAKLRRELARKQSSATIGTDESDSSQSQEKQLLSSID